MTVDETRGGPGPRRRLVAVGAATAGAMVVWLLATQAFGVDLRTPAFDASQPARPLGPGPVLLVSLLSGLAGWGLLALLERLTAARGRLVWTLLAAAALLSSLGGPLSGTGITGASRAILVALHLLVGGVLIVGLAWSASPKPDQTRPEGTS